MYFLFLEGINNCDWYMEVVFRLRSRKLCSRWWEKVGWKVSDLLMVLWCLGVLVFVYCCGIGRDCFFLFCFYFCFFYFNVLKFNFRFGMWVEIEGEGDDWVWKYGFIKMVVELFVECWVEEVFSNVLVYFLMNWSVFWKILRIFVEEVVILSRIIYDVVMIVFFVLRWNKWLYL